MSVIKESHVLVTGASRGIGKSLAKAFAREQCHLLITLRKSDAVLQNELLGLGAKSVKVLIADFSTRQGVDQFCQSIAESNQSVDILVNNAGLLTGGLLEDQNLDDIYSMMQVNLLAVIQLCHFFIPRMIKAGRGKIVNNASVSGKMFIPCANTYAASKAGVVALTESLQGELTGTPVSTLLLITPGVKTEMYDQISDQYGKNLDLSFLSSIPAEEWAQKVIEAVQKDETHLYPTGATAWGVFMGHHMPQFFRKIVLKKFKRQSAT
ncbi:SDR family NAD(P)-dependent oxidoreductase [bacterium]|nr:SDR family NAD(P)-dependent oxidoreductase [bacterium]